MPDYNSYSTYSMCLQGIKNDYDNLYKDYKKSNKSDIAIQNLKEKKLDLDIKKNCAVDQIKSYYNLNEVFSNIVWFFCSSSTDAEIDATTKAQERVANKINKMQKPVQAKALPEVTEEKKAIINDLNKELDGFDKQLFALTKKDRENINNLDSLKKQINKLKKDLKEVTDNLGDLKDNANVNSIDDIINNSIPNANKQKMIEELEIEKEKIESTLNIKVAERDVLQSNPQANIKNALQELLNKVDQQLEPYSHGSNIPLPGDFEVFTSQIKNTQGPMRQVLTKQLIENKASFEKTRKIDGHFNNLVELQASLTYRIEHLSTGISDDFQKEIIRTKEIEKKCYQEIDQLTEEAITSQIGGEIGKILKKRIDGRTWNLLTKDQKESLFNSAYTLVVNRKSTNDQINDIENKLAAYKQIRDNNIKKAHLEAAKLAR